MAGSYNAGSIVYEVGMDIRQLLEARREAEAVLNGMSGSMGRLEASVTRTERSIASIQKTMSGLSSVARAVISALSVQQVAQYGNEWVTVNNKLANSVRANESLADVTQRVFDISQNTRSSLEATATLYGRLERSTRSAGTSTKDLITLTSTINKGLAVSGATTEEASSTMTQLSQALASGVLRGEEFNSISENGSRLAVALADSLGVTIGQLRAMAAEGKLTTEVVVNGLLTQSNAIAKEFANTALTMGQAFTVATNNITKFVGESSSVSTSIRIFNDGVISLSQNLDTVANVLAVAAAIFGGRFAGAVAIATKARIDEALAAKAQTAATAQSTAAIAEAARVTTIKAGLDADMALSNLALAQTEYNVAKGTLAEAFALDNLIAKKSIAIQLSATHAESQLAEAAATRTATAAAAAATTTIGGLARGALALIGGPAGFAVIAAAGLFYFYQKMQQARQESIEFADKLDAVIAKMKSLSQAQLAAEIDRATKSITTQSEELSKNEASLASLNSRLESGRAALKNMSKDSLFYSDVLTNVNALESESIQLTAQVESAQNKLSQTVSKTGILRAQMNGTFEQGIDLLKRDGHEAGVTSGLMNQLGSAIDFASRAKEKFNSSSLKIERPKGVQDYLDKLLDQVDIEGEIDERKRAQLKAEKEIRALGGDDSAVRLARQRAGAEYDALQAQRAVKKETKDSASEQKKSATQAESVAQKLNNLRQQAELAADSTSGLTREQAILRAEQSLGKSATGEQIIQARTYAAAIWDTAAALKARNAIPELKENADFSAMKSQLEMIRSAKDAQGNLLISQKQYNSASELLEQEHQVNLAKIKATQNAGVTPLQSAQGAIDPVQALANENARKLALIQEFETEKGKITTNGLALMNAANTQYEQARIAAQWEIYRNQSAANSLLADAVDSLQGGATNAITGLLNGTQSLSEAFANIGSTILNSVVSGLVEMGLQYVKNMLMGQVAASAALGATATQATAAAGMWGPAAVSASIATMGTASSVGTAAYSTALMTSKGLAVAGAREHGGPVQANSMYRVGEGGKPEIFKASNGSQYMIPGDNGKVISNKDIAGAGGNGGVSLEVNFNITTTNGIDDATQKQMIQQMEIVALKVAREQSTRDGGFLQKRIKK